MARHPPTERRSGTVSIEYEVEAPSRVREIRLALGWSEVHASKRCGLTRKAYRAIERGEADPHLGSMIKIANAFGCTVEWAFPAIARRKAVA